MKIIASPALKAAVMLGLCAGSALLGFRMGAPANPSLHETTRITTTADMRQGHVAPRSGPSWHPQATNMSAETWTAPNPSQAGTMSPQHDKPALASVPTTSGHTKKARLERHAPHTPPRVLVPMVFRDVDPAVLGLSAAQWQEIDRMRANFAEKVGAQEPADPAYRQRWVRAQPESDEQLRAFLGWDRFNQYQIAAAQAR